MAVFGRKPIKRETHVVLKDDISRIYITRNDLLTRLLAKKCEVCGSEGDVEGYHIHKLKDLRKRYEGRRAKPDWVKRMIAMNRKTLFVCGECHDAIHAGTYDGRKLA